MVKRSQKCHLRICAVSLIALIMMRAGLANAMTHDGERFQEKISLGSRELNLNGVGTRAVFLFKGYVAGLYLAERTAIAPEAVRADGPKRLQLRMLRNASAGDFVDAMMPGLQKNLSAEDLLRMNDRVILMERMIRSIGNTSAGDVIDFDYLPETGTTVAINGVRVGTVIRGADFYGAILGVFIGANPVDEKLKRGLLGR